VPEDLRLLAVQALANTRDSASMDALVAVVDGGRTLFGRPKLAAKSTVVVAALRALAAGWRRHPNVEPFLGLAAVANDDELRDAVQ